MGWPLVDNSSLPGSTAALKHGPAMKLFLQNAKRLPKDSDG